MHPKSVLCFASSSCHAGQILDHLKAASFTSADINTQFSAPDPNLGKEQVRHSKAPEGVVVGAGIGGLLGWMAGIGLLAVPGLGVLIETSPFFAVVSGVAAGAAVCGITGGLIGQRFPKFKAQGHENLPHNGRILISVHAESPAEITQAEVIFAYAGGEGICTVEETSAADVSENNRATEIIAFPTSSGQQGRSPSAPVTTLIRPGVKPQAFLAGEV